MEEQTQVFQAIARLKQGDLAGLDTLIVCYQLQAVRSAYLIVQNRPLAEDIVQNAFARLVQKIHQFDESRPFGPWFLRSVINDAIKASKRQGRQVLLDAADDAQPAVYDRHSTVTTRPGKNGHPRRIPHYLTVQFSDGEVNGRTVALKAKERCRISGVLVDRPYSENLRSFLLDTHQAEVLAQISNSDDVADIRIRRSSACVIAQTMIQFTR